MSAKSEVQFPLSERKRRDVERADLTLRASGNSLYPESWTSHGASGDELLGVLEASLKLRNAIMSRHFCHRRWSIIE